jgi:pimeloyl-ACP methyl ester carboxylesterase
VGLFTKLALTELIPVSEATDPAVDVIFVHGLDGDPMDTWALRNEENWQTWITKAVPRANIWTLGYRLRTSKWFGGSMPMTTRAVNVLATLNVELLDELPIVFVCHSYGGLLVKQLLRSGSEIATEYEVLVERVAGIVFLGTPNQGSSIAYYAKALGPILRTSTAIQEMQRSQQHLQELTYWFRKKAEKSNWLLRAYFETVPTFGLIVVDEGSADIQIASVTPTGVDANHIDICKPPKADFRVKQTQAMIEEAALRARPKNPQSWMSRIIVAPNDQLPYLRAQIEAEQSINPRNRELGLAIAHLNSLRAPDGVGSAKVAINAPPRWFAARGGALAAVAVLLVSGFAVLRSTITQKYDAQVSSVQLNGFEQSLTRRDIKEFQEAVCVSPTGDLGPLNSETRVAIQRALNSSDQVLTERKKILLREKLRSGVNCSPH